jgi:hypothetical protein
MGAILQLTISRFDFVFVFHSKATSFVVESIVFLFFLNCLSQPFVFHREDEGIPFLTVLADALTTLCTTRQVFFFGFTFFVFTFHFTWRFVIVNDLFNFLLLVQLEPPSLFFTGASEFLLRSRDVVVSPSLTVAVSGALGAKAGGKKGVLQGRSPVPITAAQREAAIVAFTAALHA